MLIIIFLLLFCTNVNAFTNQNCYSVDNAKNTVTIRVLPVNTTKAPCTVEVEKVINGKTIKYVLYRTEHSIDACEKMAKKELLKTYRSDYACGDETASKTKIF